MYKKLFIFLIVFLLTGCWNYQELNSLAITTAIAIDITDNGEYEVSIMIANSRKSQSASQDTESQTIVYSGKGENITAALKEIDLVNPRQTYIGHVSIVIISEDIAYAGVADILDYFARDSESTKRFQLAIARDCKAKDVIKILTPLETFPAQSISQNIEVSHQSQAISTSELYADFIYDLLEDGVNPVLPSITVKGDEDDGSKSENLEQTVPEAILKLDTIGIFKEDKLLEYVSDDESRGINLIRDHIDQMNVYLEYDNCNITIEILESDTGFKLDGGDPAKIIINNKGTATIIEDNCKHDLTDNDVIKEIEKKAEKKLNSLMEKTIKVAREYKTDILGFGYFMSKRNPKYFKKFNKWDEEGFLQIDYKINTNISLKTKGAAKRTVKEAMNEN